MKHFRQQRAPAAAAAVVSQRTGSNNLSPARTSEREMKGGQQKKRTQKKPDNPGQKPTQVQQRHSRYTISRFLCFLIRNARCVVCAFFVASPCSLVTPCCQLLWCCGGIFSSFFFFFFSCFFVQCFFPCFPCARFTINVIFVRHLWYDYGSCFFCFRCCLRRVLACFFSPQLRRNVYCVYFTTNTTARQGCVTVDEYFVNRSVFRIQYA